MFRYVRLLGVQLRASGLLALQYRYDFLIDGGLSILHSVAALIPLFIVFQQRATVAGWTFPEALLVTGYFLLLEGVMDGAINPSLTSVVEHIRKGTLDFVLLKPADAQFLVSTARFQPWRATNVITAGVVFSYAFQKLGRSPDLAGVVASLLLLCASILLLYSLWIITVSAAFYVVRIDNLTYLFESVFDAARWPVQVFPGLLRLVFTFVLPLAVMTTFPAEALLGRLPWLTVFAALCGALVFAAFARRVWMRSIGKYTSASS